MVHPHRKKAFIAGRVSFDMALLDVSLLCSDEGAIQEAVGLLEAHLFDPAANIEFLVNKLSSTANLFDFVLSAINDAAASILIGWTLENFPKSATEFTDSIASQILSRISVSLVFASYPSSENRRAEVESYHHAVQQKPPVLEALPELTFAEPESPQDETTVTRDYGFVVKRKQKGKKQQSKRMRRHTVVDHKLFDNLKLDVPTTEEEAKCLEETLLLELKSTLQGLLEILRLPALRAMFKRAYVPDRTQNTPTTIIDNARSTPVEVPEADVNVPAAYPMVRPMKAALYFDSADGFGEWRILISQRADADLRQAWKRDRKMFAIYIKKIKELSNGHFSDNNQKKLCGPETDVPIYEAKMTRDQRLVYQVDCVPEYESDVERQVLKIFGIYNHRQLDARFWDSVSYQLGRKGKEYRHRCIFRNKPINTGDNVIMPASFPPPNEVAMAPSSASGIPDLNKNHLEKMHEILVLEKYVAFSQALLNSILADTDVAHVFDVSPHEKKIIENPTSCYVLGRSGTGKTTTMLFKMLGIQRSWDALGADMPKPRQIFVTQSGVLAEKVEEYFLKLLQSLSTAGQSPEDLRRIAETRARLNSGGLVDRDEEIEHRGHLPEAFSELDDEHFPLFLTFDQLCKLLEHDLPSSVVDGEADSKSATPGAPGPNQYMQQRHSGFVSFTTFLASYWPRFPQWLTKALDPHLVFGEFIGIIKGSEKTLGAPCGHLDQDTYVNLSHRSQATFATQRERIYELFLCYLKMKRARKEWDAADRTHAILSGIRQQGMPGKLMDFIYIDEAQDNLLIDALILRSICKNPSTGLFWAGDTAQTISVGSSFRFNDLKAFLYRVEAEQKMLSKTSLLQPKSFQLAINYRSHAGIVNCAHSIVKLIMQFWPHAIDSLAEERGLIEGLKPVFFSGWDQNNMRYEQFLFGDSGNQIEFGAQQCILVRDDAARVRLREQVGDVGLIMTVYESKGLEFNDVLLYNFFHDSTLEEAQWRVVLNAQSEEYTEMRGVPRFDDTRHSGICRELKMLYVAITRARMNLWIADGSEKGRPMRMFWASRKQIQICTPGTDVPRLAVSSTPEEWARTAHTLFNKRSYTQAMYSFERAGLPRERDASNAYALREDARATPSTSRNGTGRRQAFTIAAEAFEASASEAVKEKQTYFRIAGECFTEAGNNARAAHAYLMAHAYDLSAQHYRKAGMFEQAVDVVDVHRGDMTEDVADGIVDVARVFYLREHKLSEALRLFDSEDKALEYMDDYGLDVARSSLLESQGKFVEAAELHHLEGRTLKAIELLTENQAHSKTASKAARWLLDGLWKHLPLGTSPSEEHARNDTTLQALTLFLDRIDIALLRKSEQDEILIFNSIIHGETEELVRLGQRFQSYTNIPLAFACFDRALSGSLMPKMASIGEVADTLKTFLSYTELAHRLESEIGTLSDPIVRIFALQTLTEDSYLIPENTLLHYHCSTGRHFSSRVLATDGGYSIHRWDVTDLLRFVIRDRVHDYVLKENLVCKQALCFHPCLVFAAYGWCNRPNVCPQDHSEAVSKPTAATYNARIRIHLQQILVYNSVRHMDGVYFRRKVQRFWLHLLYESLHVPCHKLGGLHVLQAALIPEFYAGMQVVRAWIQDELFFTRPGDLNFLTTLTRMSTMAFILDPIGASQYIYRIPAVTQLWRDHKLCRSGGMVYVVPELIQYMQGSSPNSVAMGMLALRHILDQRVPIDIEALCDLLDLLAGMMVVGSRLQLTGTLHDITLPLSWLSRLLGNIHGLSAKRPVSAQGYIQPLADLLWQISTGRHSEHLLFGRVHLAKVGTQTRNIFIDRISQNLALLGFNYRNLELKSQIHRILTSLRAHNIKLSPLCECYSSAQTWGGVAAAVRDSVIGTPMDEMIQVSYDDRPTQGAGPGSSVRRVVYRDFAQFPAILHYREKTLRHDAIPFIPPSQVMNRNALTAHVQHQSKLEAESKAHDKQSRDQDDVASFTVEDSAEEVTEIDYIEVFTQDTTFDTPQATDQPQGPTEDEHNAACNVQAAYRRHVLAQKKASSAHYEKLRQVTQGYHKAAKEITWQPNSLYRRFLMGPIPHLAVCVDGLKDYLHSCKTHTQRRLIKVAHLELEHIQKEHNAYSTLFKEALALQQAMDPKSDLHLRRDILELKSIVQKVEALMRRLPAGATEPWEEDLALAITSIVRERRVAAKPPRPELNIGDKFDVLDNLSLSSI